jgi:hypothetical protein
MKQMLSSLDDLDKPTGVRRRILVVSETISNYAISWANMFTPLATVFFLGPSEASKELKADVQVVTEASEDLDAILYFGAMEIPISHAKAKIVYMWPFNKEPQMLSSLERPDVNSGTKVSESIEYVRSKPKPYEVWVVPQSSYCLSLIDRMYDGARIRTVPQLWTPRFTTVYGSATKDSSKGIDIALLSDMCSDTNTLLYSLLACEMLYKKNPEYVNSFLILRDKPLEQATIDLVKVLGLESKVKTVLAKEEAIVPFFHKRPTLTFFLYHQNDHTERPELLWDLMWSGLPVVHNIKTGLDVGLKYADNSIGDMVKLLQVNKKHLDEDYCLKNRGNLEKLSNGQGKVLDFLLSLENSNV